MACGAAAVAPSLDPYHPDEFEKVRCFRFHQASKPRLAGLRPHNCRPMRAAVVRARGFASQLQAVGDKLSALKPPMAPGDGGEAFYRTIPMQARPTAPVCDAMPKTLPSLARRCSASDPASPP